MAFKWGVNSDTRSLWRTCTWALTAHGSPNTVVPQKGQSLCSAGRGTTPLHLGLDDDPPTRPADRLLRPCVLDVDDDVTVVTGLVPRVFTPSRGKSFYAAPPFKEPHFTPARQLPPRALQLRAVTRATGVCGGKSEGAAMKGPLSCLAEGRHPRGEGGGGRFYRPV